jgi:hypothetical protein
VAISPLLEVISMILEEVEYELKKNISTLQWDLAHIKPGEIRKRKEDELRLYAQQLSGIAKVKT